MHRKLIAYLRLLFPLYRLQAFCNSLFKEHHGFGVSSFRCQVKWSFAVIALHIQVRAAIKQSADHAFISVLCGRVERGVAALFAHIWISPVFQEHFYDFGMTRRGRRLNWRGVEAIT